MVLMLGFVRIVFQKSKNKEVLGINKKAAE